MAHGEVGLGDADGGPVMAGDAQVAGERLQQFDLVRQDQDLDASGARLNGAKRYVVTFAKDQTPPVNGFWSLTLYNQHHFFVPNEIERYSVGTKNKDLKHDPDLRHIPIIVLTTSLAEDDVQRAYGSYANCYIVKPVDFIRFAEVVRSIESFWFSLVLLPSGSKP